MDDPRLCFLVVIGVTSDDQKELLSVEDGYRESKESWAEVLRDLKRRGMNVSCLMIADRSLGIFVDSVQRFWSTIKTGLFGPESVVGMEQSTHATNKRRPES